MQQSSYLLHVGVCFTAGGKVTIKTKCDITRNAIIKSHFICTNSHIPLDKVEFSLCKANTFCNLRSFVLQYLPYMFNCLHLLREFYFFEICSLAIQVSLSKQILRDRKLYLHNEVPFQHLFQQPLITKMFTQRHLKKNTHIK